MAQSSYINANFKNFFNDNGIIHEDTIRYSPQQNGRVERLHGTLVSNANAMLRDAKLHHKFLEDAVATANYLHNRLPHKGNNKKVPYELLYGQPVDYNKLKVFGCQVYYYIPKQLRKKFNNTTHPGIFIGYDEVNHTTYKIYDTIDNKIILACAVIFFEDEPANIPAPLSNPTYQNFLPYYEVGGMSTKMNLLAKKN